MLRHLKTDPALMLMPTTKIKNDKTFCYGFSGGERKLELDNFYLTNDLLPMETATKEISVEAMTPHERSKVQALKKLKHYIENTSEAFSLYTIGKDLGISTLELSTIVKLGMITKHKSESHLRYLYTWSTGEPNRAMYREIAETGREYHREVSKKSQMKKKKAERRELERKRALREAEANRIKKAKLRSIKTEGKILDPNNHDLINTLKARCEGYTEERLDVLAAQYAQPQQDQAVENNIPITVNVTTQGNRKTVNINILV